jgi:hypothetical protein
MRAKSESPSPPSIIEAKCCQVETISGLRQAPAGRTRSRRDRRRQRSSSGSARLRPAPGVNRTSGAAAVLDANVVIKRRKRGLTPSELVEGLFSLWAAGGDRCEDLAELREHAAFALLFGHGLPAPQTARDFLAAFDEAVPAALAGRACGGAGRRTAAATVGAGPPAAGGLTAGAGAADGSNDRCRCDDRYVRALLPSKSAAGTAVIGYVSYPCSIASRVTK